MSFVDKYAKDLLRECMIARGALHRDDNVDMEVYWANLREDPFFDEDSKAEFRAMAYVVLNAIEECAVMADCCMNGDEAAEDIRSSISEP